MLIKELLNIAETVGTAVLYLLIALSVLSLAITIERLVYYLRRRVDAASLGKALAARLREKDLAGMRTLLEGSRSVEAAVMREALPWLERGPDSLHEVVEAALREKKGEYEWGLLFLGTLGNNAPFIGLFGTVLGVIKAFGYGNRAIAAHFVKLALLVVVSGTLLGIPVAAWLGEGLAAIYRDFFHFPHYEWQLSARGLAMSVAISAASAFTGAYVAVLGAIVSFRGFRVQGTPFGNVAWKGVFWVTLSIVLYGVLLKPLGMVLASLVLILVGSIPSGAFKWKEVIILYVILIVMCVATFVYGLKLPIGLWPEALG